VKVSLYNSNQAKADTTEKESPVPFFGKEKNTNSFFIKPAASNNVVQRQENPPAPTVIGNCPNYDPNEIPRSRTAAGWLPQDFTSRAADEFLFADFGNDHSFVKTNAQTEALWQDWKRRFLTDGSYRIKITGYSDCSGLEAVNIAIRRARAENIQRAIGPGVLRKVSFMGMANMGTFVTPNDTPENRARNRSVVIKHKQGFFTQPDAEANARDAETAIRTAILQLSSSLFTRERNIPSFLATNGITIVPLTPRHEGTVVTPDVSFFPATNYSLNFTLRQLTRFHIYDSDRKIAVQCRNMPDITAMATPEQIRERIVQAVSQMAHLQAAGSAAGSTFEQYKAQFNAWWNVMPYRSMMPEFNPSLDSFGPRYRRAREIFRQIYSENATIRREYDDNTGGLKEKIDTYNVPDGYNRINSPRLQALRAVFTTVRPPVNTANYAGFKASIETAAGPLDGPDRATVEESNDWQNLINWYVRDESRRNEIRSIIRTHHSATSGSTTSTTTTSTPMPSTSAPPRGTAQQINDFLTNIRIQGSHSMVNSDSTLVGLRLTPRSSRRNPGIDFNTRFRIEPAARAADNAVSPEHPWPANRRNGVSEVMVISNTGTVTITAHLDLLNLPAEITPVVPPFTFQLNDIRQSDFLAHWAPKFVYSMPGGDSRYYQAGDRIRYVGGAQNFEVMAGFRTYGINPGLPINVAARLTENGRVVTSNNSQPQPFPSDEDRSSSIMFSVPRPATMPATGVPYVLEVDILDASGSVLDTKTIRFTVFDEITFTEPDALRNAREDYDFFRNTSSRGLIGIMRRRGGLAARVATAITTGDADGGILLLPLTARHDSADYVTRTSGQDATQGGYFVGVDYTNSMVAEASATGFRTSDFPHLASKVIVVNRTRDVARNAKRPVDAVIETLVHEAVHAMDMRPNPDSLIEGYKTEFRAYWMDGSYGPPNVSDCSSIAYSRNCYSADFNDTMLPPGPKSQRARKIFEHLYHSQTYAWFKREYDINITFRQQVDNYLYPDGINLIASVRLERLRALIENFTGSGFAALRAQVRQYMGHGVAPTGGALDAEEKLQIRNNRAWRDLVERKITVAADQLTLKADLGIPTHP
jgi:outer membrane protein OmpA-like peptidoglycan-associated protein